MTPKMGPRCGIEGDDDGNTSSLGAELLSMGGSQWVALVGVVDWLLWHTFCVIKCVETKLARALATLRPSKGGPLYFFLSLGAGPIHGCRPRWWSYGVLIVVDCRRAGSSWLAAGRKGRRCDTCDRQGTHPSCVIGERVS